jgi:hypothetical protein
MNYVLALQDLGVIPSEFDIANDYNNRMEDDRTEDPIHSEEATVNVHPFTAKLSWGIVLIAERKYEAVRLMNNAVRFFHKRPYLRIPIKAGSSDYVDVDLVTEDWDPDDQPQNSIYTYASTIEVSPVYLDDDYGDSDSGVPVEDTSAYKTEDAETAFLELEVESQ